MPGLAAAGAPQLGTLWAADGVDAVADLAWAADGSLWGGGMDGWIRCYGADGEVQEAWSAHRAGVTRVCPAPAGGPLASAGEDGCVWLWPRQSAGDGAVLMEEPGWIEHLAWSPDGRVLAAAAEKTVFLWRGRESAGVWYDARRRVLAMAWAPDSKRLATASNKGLFLLGLAGGDPMQLLEYPGASVAVAWAPRGDALAVGTQDGFLQVWRRAGSGRKASNLTMRGYPGKVSCLAWHPRRLRIASAGGPEVVLWDLGTAGSPRAQTLRGHEPTVSALAYAPDGTRLASADRAGVVQLWGEDAEPLDRVRVDGEVTALRWRADGARLAVGSTEGQIRVFDTG